MSKQKVPALSTTVILVWAGRLLRAAGANPGEAKGNRAAHVAPGGSLWAGWKGFLHPQRLAWNHTHSSSEVSVGAQAHGRSEVKAEGTGQKDQAVYEHSPKWLHCRRPSFEKITVPPTGLMPRWLNMKNTIPFTHRGRAGAWSS